MLNFRKLFPGGPGKSSAGIQSLISDRGEKKKHIEHEKHTSNTMHWPHGQISASVAFESHQQQAIAKCRSVVVVLWLLEPGM